MRSKHIRITYFFFYCLLCGLAITSAQAQVANYPVLVSPAMFRPFPASLSDLATTARTQLVVNLTNKSITGQVVDGLVRVDIEFGSVRASTAVRQFPITLLPGENKRITNTDLAPYLQLNNLAGITAQAYVAPFQSQRLRLIFAVFDRLTGRQLSQNSSYTTSYEPVYPPILTAPVVDTVPQTAIQNINFTWQPRTDLSGQDSRYVIEIVELLQPNQDAQAAFATNRLFFVDSVIGVYTNYVYNATKPLLIPGKAYAWRVTVKFGQVYGITGYSLVNGGVSNARKFVYKENCLEPTDFRVVRTFDDGVLVSWKAQSMLREFTFRYAVVKPELSLYDKTMIAQGKKAAPVYGPEYDRQGTSVINPRDNSMAITGLKARQNYYIVLSSVCPDGTEVRARTQYFTTDGGATSSTASSADNNFQCGVKPPSIGNPDAGPLLQLKPNDLITAGDISIRVSDASGSNGIYSGTGEATFWLNKPFQVNVKFTKISVNSEYKVTSGSITQK